MTIEDQSADPILAPIAGDHPSGANGRVDATLKPSFKAIRDTASQKRKAENTPPPAPPNPALKQEPNNWGGSSEALDANGFADWAAVGDDAEDYLASKSKDLSVACIFVEASLRRDGLAGLAAALDRLEALLDRFWDIGLHPGGDLKSSDETNTARRQAISNLGGEQGTLVRPMARLELAPGLAYWRELDCQQAQKRADNARDADQRDTADAARDAGLREIDAIAARTAAAAARAAVDLVERCASAWYRILARVSPDTADTDAETEGTLGERLSDIQQWLRRIFAAKLTIEATSEPPENGAGALPEVAAGGTQAGAQPWLGDRAAALGAILSAADYFERAEPHSPVGPALRNAHRRALMKFDDLMTELLSDDEVRTSFYLQSGLKPPTISNDEG